MTVLVSPATDPGRRRAVLERLTSLLPEWFGIPESNAHYAAQAEVLPGWLARKEHYEVGLLLLKRHGPLTAEIYWLGVHPAHHHQGVGRALVGAAARRWSPRGAGSLSSYRFIRTIRTNSTVERAGSTSAWGSRSRSPSTTRADVPSPII